MTRYESRQNIKLILKFLYEAILSLIVFWVTFVSIPTIQAIWNKTNIMEAVFGHQIGSRLHSEKYAVIGESTIKIDIADSISERTKGLSGRKTLNLGEGLLFIFDKPDLHGIWMKEMNFGLDIIWVSENTQVIHIEQNVSPNTYPKVFTPRKPALYVLEVPAGYVAAEGIKIGDWMSLL